MQFCLGFSAHQHAADHQGPCCGSVGGPLSRIDEPTQAKPFESPPGYPRGGFRSDQSRRSAAAFQSEVEGKPCHCPHVTELMADTDVFKIFANQLEGRINSVSGPPRTAQVLNREHEPMEEVVAIHSVMQAPGRHRSLKPRRLGSCCR